MFSIRGGEAIGYVAMLEIFLFLNHEGKQWISHKHRCAIFMLVKFLISVIHYKQK